MNGVALPILSAPLVFGLGTVLPRCLERFGAPMCSKRIVASIYERPTERFR